jgi:hypothetical protein
MIIWDVANISEISSNNRYKEYKESSHMTCLTNYIGQYSLDVAVVEAG